MFNEQNAVENYVRDLLTKPATAPAPPQTPIVAEPRAAYATTFARTAAVAGWEFVAGKDLPRSTADVLLAAHLTDALIALNPEIAAVPSRADDVVYRLKAILFAVGSDGLVKANEEFASWLRGERTMPFGANGDHVPVRLLDFSDPAKNRAVLSTQVVYSGGAQKRFDLVLFLNGIPVAVGEAKTPSRPAVSWVDGASQIHDDYEKNAAAFFVPNVLSFATEGKTFRFGAVRMPIELWAPWRDDENAHVAPAGMREVRQAILGLLRPETLLDILLSFSLFATDAKHRKIKIICRYQQYEATNKIVARVVEGRVKKGLLWHFQGSGKSLLMVFAAQKLRRQPALKAPTVLIVVDRIELDAQITATFNATDVPNVEAVDSRERLRALLGQDTRKVLITTIHKFAEAGGELNARSNIILLCDEAHRTQEGDLGRKMREALPNAFLFGLTGTPINKRDRNTFWAFGADEDAGGYLSRYSFEESIRDGATRPLHFEPRLVRLHVDRATIDAEFARVTGSLTENDAAHLSRQAGKMAVLVKSPERIRAICGDIAKHFLANVEPNGFKAQVVVYDQESCHLYKAALDEFLPTEASTVVISVSSGESDPRLSQYKRDRDDEEKLLDRFRDAADPLQILIVTARLLTGFDAPILQTMYLDKPMKEHSLLQAICRTNRPYKGKSHGLIVDYLGVFDDVARAFAFDEAMMKQVATNLQSLCDELPERMAKCLGFFAGVDRTLAGYEGLLAAQECLPNNEVRDAFAAAFSALSQIWEAVSPNPVVAPFDTDYRWLGQVYESVKPPSGNGKLVWHALGAKTLELIHQNVHVESLTDELEKLVLDPEVLESLTFANDPKKTKEIEIQIVERLRHHAGNPKFVALGQRLEDLRDRFEQGLMVSIEFLKQLLQIAREVVEAEQEVNSSDERQQAKAALTELFRAVRPEGVPLIVERVVDEIDSLVSIVRFPGWQNTHAGEREVKKALRRALMKFQLHGEQDLFDKAYAYIRQYYAI